VKEMAFYEHIKQFRIDVLRISQKKAAKLLNIEQSTLSNYERGTRQIPVGMLPLLKTKYGIDESKFVDMLFERGDMANYIREEQAVLRAVYENRINHELVDLIQRYPTLQEHLHDLLSLPPSAQKNRIDTLNHLLSILKKQHPL